MREKYQIVVVGGGLVGAAAALALARQGWSLALIDAGPPANVEPGTPLQTRVSTLSPASINILRRLGAWTAQVVERACPFYRMRIWEDDPAAELSFHAADAQLEHLGQIAENDSVQAALWQALADQPSVRLYPGATVQAARDGDRGVRIDLDRGGVLAELLVAADGADSPLRRAFGFEVREWDYQQRGLVGPVSVAAGHQHTAWQRFLRDGPLAFLPLADGGCSIVWSMPSAKAEQLAAGSAEALGVELTGASQGRLGEVRCTGRRVTFPLKRLRAERYLRGRVVLMGDAAHVVHPLAGQGANLGLLDAASLAEVLEPVRDARVPAADPVALRAYERWRRSDNEIMATALHALKAVYRADAPPVTFGRRLGVGLISRSRVLRARLIAHASGYGGRVPLMAQPPAFGAGDPLAAPAIGEPEL